MDEGASWLPSSDKSLPLRVLPRVPWAGPPSHGGAEGSGSLLGSTDDTCGTCGGKGGCIYGGGEISVSKSIRLDIKRIPGVSASPDSPNLHGQSLQTKGWKRFGP